MNWIHSRKIYDHANQISLRKIYRHSKHSNNTDLFVQSDICRSLFPKPACVSTPKVVCQADHVSHKSNLNKSKMIAFM